jgi:two-component system, NtrC family, sensor kinase
MPSIEGIAGEIEQMFFILVQNAIQAAKSNKKQWFNISGSVKGEHIELVFSDNCGGIEPCNIDEIFEPFFTTKPAEQGTGLGLAILQQIMIDHNGSVRVDSKFEQGTTFYVTLPIKRLR